MDIPVHAERQARAEIRNRSIPTRLRSGPLEQRTTGGKKLAESPPSPARLVRLLPVLGHLRAFQFGRRFEPPLREVLEHGFQMRVAGPFGQFSTPQRALSALLRVHAYRPTHRVLCAGPGQGIQGSSKPRPGGLGGSLSPAPSRGRSPSCAGCALCRASIFWTEHTSGPERRAWDRRSPSACGMLIVTARWSAPRLRVRA